MPAGRPTLYTKELATEICNLISENMLSLKTLCKQNPHWPDMRTIRAWIREKEEFSHMYAQAKDEQIDLMAEEIIEISDDSVRDTVVKTNKNGDEYETCDYEWVARSKLRVDSRKWIASKLKAKKYGDKINVSEIDEAKVLLDKLREHNAKS